jgi:sigma-E factor negative regulatory protein RseC
MSEGGVIDHEGIVEELVDNTAKVVIDSQSACAACHAKGACSVADVEEKIIEVRSTDNQKYKKGDKVDVGIKRSLGSRAVFLGYFLPFMILVLALIILLAITDNELLSGILSIVLLVPYYLILYIMRDKLKKTFEFTILD